MTVIAQIPTAEIDAEALPRDRTALAEEPLDELAASIRRSGLRQPIEVWAIPDGGYGLISGYRRLAAFKKLLDWTEDDRWESVPAFVREPRDIPAAIASMVEENEIRSGVSAWEKACLILQTLEEEVFDNEDAAIHALFPNLARMKRARIRAVVEVVTQFAGHLNEPEAHSLRRLLALHGALIKGYAPVMVAALREDPDAGPEEQWARLKTYIDEAKSAPAEHPKRPGRPKRLAAPQADITIRREAAKGGYALIFTGARVNNDLMDRLFSEMEHLLS